MLTITDVLGNIAFLLFSLAISTYYLYCAT